MRPVLTQSQTIVFMTGIVLFTFGFQTTLCQGQTNRNFENASQNTQDLQSRIRGETVQRQSEFLRVDTTSSQLAKRVSTLEGRLLLTRTYPTITIREANAALDLARAQSRELRSQPVKPSDVQIAEEQLAISRAESQLAITLALQKERLLLCELNVLDAERELLRTTNFYALQERLAARGITTPQALAEDKMTLNFSQKKLELMRLRLVTQQTLEESMDARPNKANVKPTAASPNP